MFRLHNMHGPTAHTSGATSLEALLYRAREASRVAGLQRVVHAESGATVFAYDGGELIYAAEAVPHDARG